MMDTRLSTYNQSANVTMGSAGINFLTFFADTVSRYPGQVALLQSENSYTYAELDIASNNLASYLIKQGLAPGQLVGCYLQRSPNLVISIIAALKAGAAFLLLDTNYPEVRVRFMLDDACPQMVLHDGLFDRVAYAFSGLSVNVPGVLPDIQKSPVLVGFVDVLDVDRAYVIYTSGSTGRPKGVQISHGALKNQLHWLQNCFEFGPADRFLQKTPISFDASVWELLAPMCSGSTLVLADPKAHHDPAMLCAEIVANDITVLQVVPSVLRLVLELNFEDCCSLKRVFCGGEALSETLAGAFFNISQAELHNLYGPTEATINATHWQCEKGAKTISIGKPVDGMRSYVLDEYCKQVKVGEAGELYLAGEQLAIGYLGNDAETDKRFVTLDAIPESRLYRTGDIVRQHPDGTLLYIGREDDQLKIHGVRVEAGEIESAINAYTEVNHSVVKVERHETRGDELVAYLHVHEPGWNDTAGLRKSLVDSLPAPCVPHHYELVETFPLSPSGKIDKTSLKRAASSERPALSVEYRAPGTAAEQLIASLWSKTLGVSEVGLDDSFFELGGNSLSAYGLIVAVNREMGLSLSIIDLFESPTIGTLLNHKSHNKLSERPVTREPASLPTNDDIAVIGMAGRFPGARNIQQFWQNLCDGVESTTFFSDSDLDQSISEELRSDPAYVKACAVMPETKCFDAAFFGVSPREAAVIDPQQRIFLETCWEALEDAGIVIEEDNQIGVFGGTGNNTYYLTNILPATGVDAGVGEMARIAANEKDYTATRVAFKLGLKGPAISVQTACSTSLVAVAMACQSLRAGYTTAALAGGVSVNTPINSGHLYQEGSMLSPDGLTRPFDKEGQGTAFNSGAGIVVLKLLEHAKKDDDRIYAVIKGVGLNNDGADKASFTAPGIQGQQSAVQQALTNAKIDARTVSYVETHGTATPLGDPIEIEALTRAFRNKTESADNGYCAIGSVKSNFGHAVAAAGVAGLIKTCLSLHHRKIPPSLHFSEPNPEIQFSSIPFYVNTALTDWHGKVLRAGVSSFGVGGTNAHIVLENWESKTLNSDEKTESAPQVLLISAKAEEPLDSMAVNLAQYFDKDSTADMTTAAFNLQTRRTHFSYRRYIVVGSKETSVDLLLKPTPETSKKNIFSGVTLDVVFMFPGQGTQYPGMGTGLYRLYKTYKDIVDDCLARLDGPLREIVKPILLAGKDDDFDTMADRLNRTEYAQVAIFIIEYAVAKLWQSWGVMPAALIGHSIGEFVAAALANVFSLDDALKLVSARGKLMQMQPSGSMLSVRLPAEQLRSELTEHCDIAAINGPQLCVVSGPDEDILSLQSALEERDVPVRLLQTSHAFHSPMMDAVLEPFREVVASVNPGKPELPILSTVTGDWLTEDQATDVEYWTTHLRKTVRFSDGVRSLLNTGQYLYLEAGPRSTTATLVAQQMSKNNRCAVASSLPGSPVPGDTHSEQVAILRAVGDLWLNGVDIDWLSLHGLSREIISLPGYPFVRREHWLEPAATAQASIPAIENTILAIKNQLNGAQKQLERAMPTEPGDVGVDRKSQLLNILRELFSDESGDDLFDVESDTSFLALGFDSLLLTQVATSLKQRFKVDIAFRRLMEDLLTFEELTEYLFAHADESLLPSSAQSVAGVETVSDTIVPQPGNSSTITNMSETLRQSIMPVESVQELINAQLKIMEMQLQALRSGAIGTNTLTTPASAETVSDRTAISASEQEEIAGQSVKNISHSRGVRIAKEKVGLQLSKTQQQWLDRVMEKYQEKYANSRAYAQEHRRHLADPRTVSGFGLDWKEVVFPIVTKKSKGSKLWDIDGNELIDTANGFGPIFFGHSPDFVTEAIKQQLDEGIETGPQSPLAGEVAKLLCELTGNERCTFSCTGSEAVLGAIRLARTVTGRSKVVMFEGGYHGITDEVISRAGRNYQGLPASPGIPRESTSNMIVLPWGDEQSLDLIGQFGDELAAVLVEPVQSRMPEFHDQEYIQKIRSITAAHDTALILDEVVTGFRVAAGGIRERFNIDSDLATYGKVVGGGFPIGMIAGKAKFMDALDGGYWEYGDASVPESGVTFYAGTFVRHPLGLAAAKVIMEKIKSEGPELYQSLDKKTADMASEAKAFIAEVKCDVTFEEFATLFYVTIPGHTHWGHMLFMLMRMEGIHIQHNRANFLTTEHSQNDVNKIVAAFKKSLAELIIHGLIEGDMVAAKKFLDGKKVMPEGARLGRNANGDPAYFIQDPANKSKYIEVGKP